MISFLLTWIFYLWKITLKVESSWSMCLRNWYLKTVLDYSRWDMILTEKIKDRYIGQRTTLCVNKRQTNPHSKKTKLVTGQRDQCKLFLVFHFLSHATSSDLFSTSQFYKAGERTSTSCFQNSFVLLSLNRLQQIRHHVTIRWCYLEPSSLRIDPTVCSYVTSSSNCEDSCVQ